MLVSKTIIQQLKDYDASKMQYPCVGQVKMDGIFGRRDPETQEFYTRAGNIITGLASVQAELKDYDRPLDGELVIPGLDFFTMNGLLRSFNPTPTCLYYIFDRPTQGGQYESRQISYYEDALLLRPHVRRIRAHFLMNQEEADEFYHKVIAAGHEGVVYKKPAGLYRHGKHWENMKRVPIKSCECKILSAYEGKGKFEGVLGGFVVDFNGVKVKVGGGPGVDMMARVEYWKNQDKYIGQMMKCSYKKLTAKGSMRSPQMCGIRWDI